MRTLELDLPHRRSLRWWEEPRDPNHYNPPNVVRQDNTQYLYSVLGGEKRIRHLSRTGLVTVEGRGYAVPNTSLLVQNAHQCFDGHVGIRLSPVVFMDIIVRELATVIRANPDRYAYLFTSRPGEKVTIRIRNDEVLTSSAAWKDAFESFYLPLREAITDATFELFAPRFSTLTEEDGIAQLVALMDAASPYYDYRVDSMCGIPLFELDGDAADWRLLVDHVEQLALIFPDLAAYFRELVPVLIEVAETAASGTWDKEFWRSFYKWHSTSGGCYANGWITALFAHTYEEDGPKLKQPEQFRWRRTVGTNYGGFMLNRFPSGISAVPFTWELRGSAGDRDVPMLFVAGALGIEQTLTKTLEARLGYAVVEA